MDNRMEIERKFLVKGDFYPYVTKKERIVQAYLTTTLERTVRIRIKGAKAFISIKGATGENGFSRLEFEYPIPVRDARELMGLAQPGLIEKERHYVPYENHLFEVDVFHGDKEGLIVAELELQTENEAFEKPDWLGEEVTFDRRYYNAYLASHSISELR
jgi:CYTH domain-containing protein